MAKRGATGKRAGPGPLLLRQIHLYLGVFVAPSVLFFAFTGALQLFSLHEAHGGYQPPPLIESLAKVHKDQVFAVKHRSAPDEEAPPARHRRAPEQHRADEAPRKTTLALKLFFLFVSASLIVTTLLGLWMALVQSRSKVVAWGLLIIGGAIPIALLVL